MRRRITALLATGVLLIPAVAQASNLDFRRHRSHVSFAPVVQEWNVDGTAADGDTVGWSIVRRTNDRVGAMALLRGLKPGGVYTFWLIAVQEDGTFPDDVFVTHGDSAIVGRSGRAFAHISARIGDSAITGFKPDGLNELEFADLTDTKNSTIRIEIAYHGQASDAGADLNVWLSDFWTGSACPPETPNPNPAQPHCPVYYAATHSS